MCPKSFFFFPRDTFVFIGKSDVQRRIDREEDLLSADSLPKRPQWLELSQSKARSPSLFQVSHVDAGSQGFGPFLTAFLGYKQGAGWEA